MLVATALTLTLKKFSRILFYLLNVRLSPGFNVSMATT